MPCQNEENRSYKGEVGKVAANLLNRAFHAEKMNQKWVTGVTEFSLLGEKLYLSPILDLCSSDLVSYTISDRAVLSMVTTMLNKAFEKNRSASPFRPRLAIPAQAVSTNAADEGYSVEYEPERKLFGQCCDGEFSLVYSKANYFICKRLNL